MRIGILSHTQKLDAKPERYVSKNAANALLRRLLAVRVTKGLIQMVAIREMCQAAPYNPAIPPKLAITYQHHIEPRLERLTQIELERQLDQDYLRFLREFGERMYSVGENRAALGSTRD